MLVNAADAQKNISISTSISIQRSQTVVLFCFARPAGYYHNFKSSSLVLTHLCPPDTQVCLVLNTEVT